MREMNSKVHPLVVVLVIVLTIFAIGVWIWGTGQAKKISGPAELRTDPDGHLYIQIQNQLLEHDADGVFLDRHDLAQIGVEAVLGTFAFFSDGDDKAPVKIQEAPLLAVAPPAFTAFVSFVLFVYPGFFVKLAKMAARGLVGG